MPVASAFLKPLLATAFLVCVAGPLAAQLFDNLEALSNRVRVGQPGYVEDAPDQWRYLNEFPKSLVTGDFDGDGHADWAVARLDGKIGLAYGRGDGSFLPITFITTPAGTYRQLLAADLNGDGRLDLAGCDPFQGVVYLILNQGSRSWKQPVALAAWIGVRNLAAGDFDGDGVTDLVMAGPDRDQRYDWATRKLLSPLPTTTQPAHGVAYLRGIGAGEFASPTYYKTLATISLPTFDEEDSFPRPVYCLKTWRPDGSTRDRLVAAHATSSLITVLEDDGTGNLAAVQILQAQGKGIRALALGPLYQAASSNLPDLVVANRDLGLVEVFRGHPTLGFSPAPDAAYLIPHGPRALDLADLNRDGWLDLVVAERHAHKVEAWQNQGDGNLRLTGETATGLSPREMAQADFDGDGRTDFVVLNRDSADVSVLLANSLTDTGTPRAGFKTREQTYPTEGEVAQLMVQDLNNDSRADILQLHRLSEEVSVRLSLPGGLLGPSTLFKMGTRPESMVLTDANSDGQLDLVTTNVGDAQGGLYAVRLGTGTGSFGPVTTYRPPLEQALPPPPNPSASLPSGVGSPVPYAKLFSVLSADLDGDGIKDLVAGYYDCRGAVLRGQGDGTYLAPPPEDVFELAYESRFMVSGDFDQDGDTDLAAGSWSGQVVVLENTGNFFRKHPGQPQFIRHDYPYGSGFAGARELVARDFDGDGDLDLVSATGQGVAVLLGRAGATFERQTYPNPRPDGSPILTVPDLTYPVQTMAWGRFDADEDLDLATICRDDNCLRISTNETPFTGRFAEALVVDCPPTDYLQAGDVDGDGLTDLVGTGSVLWVALSGHAAQPVPPRAGEPPARPRPPGLVLNEIIADNHDLPINQAEVQAGGAPSFFSQHPDCVELFHGGTAPLDLTGWKIEYVSQGQTKTFALPPESLPAGGHQVVLFYKEIFPESAWRTGFALAKEGGSLRLLSPTGETADAVTYPALEEDQGYARFADGDPTWGITSLPNPGFPNVAGGNIKPAAKLNGIDLAEFSLRKQVRFYATASDDLGVMGMTVYWRKTGQVSPFRKVLLYDDGMKGDGGRLDGVFSGLFTDAPAGGTSIEFYLESEDLGGSLTRQPGSPQETDEEGTAPRLYTLVLPTSAATARGLEISEMMPSGSTLADPTGTPTNWVEIRNTSDSALSLDGVELADSLFGDGARAVFPDNLTLAPGEHRLVWSRPLNLPGVLSGDLKLGSKNEELTLVRRDATGSQQILSFLQGGAVPDGMSAARIGAGGPIMALPPTPGLPNVKPDTLALMPLKTADGVRFRLIYRTTQGLVPNVQRNVRFGDENWISFDLLPGDGLERLHEEAEAPHIPQLFFRLRP